MKKLLSLVLAIALVLLALPTAVLAANGSSEPEPDPYSAPVDFSKLITGTGEVSAPLLGIYADGFIFGLMGLGSITDFLTTTTLNGITAFKLDSPSVNVMCAPVFADTSERGKMVGVLKNDGSGWETVHSDELTTPVLNASGVVGYATDSPIRISGDNSCTLTLLLSTPDEDNVCSVYPFIIATSDSDSNPVLAWNDAWPKTDAELTAALQAADLDIPTNVSFSYYITPSFGSKKGRTNLLYLPITATAGEGGSITEPGEKLFKPGSITQAYTVTADKEHTIHYIQVDGKTVPNSVNCGDTAIFRFSCIYGPRSISAVFRNK